MSKIKKVLLLVIVGLFASTPIVWFLTNKGSIINGLDTNFPIDPLVWFLRRFYIWNGTVNGGGHFSSSVSGLFFHFLQVVPYAFGASLRMSELFSLLFWSLAICASAYAFASIFVEKQVNRFIFVCLYAYNIYLFNTWENVKVSNLALVVGLPLTIVLIHRLFNKSLSYFSAFVLSLLAGIVLSGAGINPGYFLCILLGSGIYIFTLLLFNKNKGVEVIKASLIVFLGVFLANFFWIASLFDFLFLSSKVNSLSSIGYTDWLQSLSENTSALNVVRLQGAWDWYSRDVNGAPLYIPYALNYFTHPIFIIFSFVSPILSLLSLVLRDRKKEWIYFFSSVVVLLGLFLGMGAHEPSGKIFLFLVRHVPFFSFFRSPWYIFTPLTIIGLASLTSLFFENIESRIHVYSKNKKVSLVLFSVSLLYVVGHLVYSYPQLTGKIYRPGRSDSYYVKFPQFVFETQKWLDSSDANRILTYPDDQLESFNWGYRGTESILNLFSKKEVVTPSFGIANKTYEKTLNTVYNHLKRGEYESGFRTARAFSVDTLFTKTDTDTLAPVINDRISNFASLAKRFDNWSFFRLNNEYSAPKVYVASNIYSLDNLSDNFSSVAKVLNKNDVVIDSKDTALKALGASSLEIRSILFPTLTNLAGNISTYTFLASKDMSSRLIVDNYASKKNIQVYIDNRLVPEKSILEKDSYIELADLSLTKGEHIVKVVYSENVDLFATKALQKYKDITRASIDKVDVDIDGFDPKATYSLTFKYKYSYGHLPFLSVTQFNGTTKYRVTNVPLYDNRDWVETHLDISPVLVNSSLRLTLEDNVNSKTINLTEFKDFSLKKTNKNGAFIMERGKETLPQTLKYTKISPTLYTLEIPTQNEPYVLVTNDTYDSSWLLSSKEYIGNKRVHFSANGISNAWYIPISESANQMTIEFTSQKPYMIALLISILATAGIPLLYVGWRLILWRKQKIK